MFQDNQADITYMEGNFNIRITLLPKGKHLC